jgi:CDP-glycerol glycerophosphotransferase
MPPVVVYDSWRGRYADSPRAIHQELVRRDAALRHVWVLSPDQPVPADAEVVRPHSPAHLRALAQARYVVANDLLPLYYVKTPATTVVQTWHGTPLKKIGLDVVDPTYAHARRYRWHLRRNSRLWDHLVSQNPFSTPIFRRAFGYRGSVLEVGYPRNDELVHAGAETVATTRKRFGIPEGRRTVAFAPTWRDSGARAPELERDVRRLAEGLGDDHTVLLRLHRHEASALRGASLPDNVVDVSGHGEINDVLLAADSLVTDYSSLMFDFAVTGRPIHLYVPDLEQYRDIERGWCFDLLTEGPGPALRTIDELVDAVATGATDSAAAARFRTRFAPLDDGRAAARVVEAVFPA